MYEFITIKEHDGRIVEVALNRPEAMNALNMDLLKELTACFTGLGAEKEVRGIVLTGTGKAFCAGGDLKGVMQTAVDAGTRLYELASQFHLAVMEIRRVKKPVVAAINGSAFGGGFSLALACDFRVLETSAVIKMGYCARGLCPDGGLTFHLPKMIGHSRALEMAAFDDPITNDQALDWGLVTKVVEDGQSFGEALGLLRRISEISLHSFGRSKMLINNSFHATLESQLEMERLGLRDCADHPDGKEGMLAFLEKRKPNFLTN
jgi:2-(1,2-epoxy-1,2-dihydrophenyl)acetyl-CoA isomerase